MDYIAMHQTATPNLQSIINQSLVFHYLKEHGPSYRARISLDLNISLPAVGRALDELIERKFVILSDYRKNDQMRRVPFYSINLDDFVIISLDAYNNLITSDHSGLVRKFDLDQQIDLGEAFIDVIDRFVRNDLAKDISMIRSICIAFPGIVNTSDGIVEKAVYHPEFERFPIKDRLEEHYGCTVFIDNVVNLAVVQNKFELEERKLNVVAIDIGMEIGAGILIDGKVYRGENFIAGEIGYYTDSPIYEKKESGHSSTLRKLAMMVCGATGVEPCDLHQRSRCVPIVVDAFGKAHDGDAGMLGVIDQFSNEIALLINKIDPLLNPAAIVISGEICTIPYSKELFFERVVEKYHNLRFSNVTIMFSPSGPLAGLLGGVLVAEDNFMKQQFPYVMAETGEK